jgi:hypothetical protein
VVLAAGVNPSGWCGGVMGMEVDRTMCKGSATLSTCQYLLSYHSNDL